jgi:PAS domain-containing protein
MVDHAKPPRGIRAQSERDTAHSSNPSASNQSASNQFEMLVDGMREYAIYLIDVDGHLLSWNKGAARIKGYTSKEILGQHFSIFYIDADRQNGIPTLSLQKAAQDGKFEAEGWRRRKNARPDRHANPKFVGSREKLI